MNAVARIACKRHGVCAGCGATGRRHTPLRASLADRFWAKCEPEPNSGCWIWLGSTTGSGHGVIQRGRRREGMMLAHRLAYELLRGEIPDGLCLDHLCRVRSCVNPWHLEPVTIAENTLRGQSPAIVAHRVGVCLRGHPLAGGNLYRNPSTGKPECWACKALRNGLRPRKGRQKKLSEAIVARIKLRLARGETNRAIATSLGVSYGLISEIRRGAIWRHVLVEEPTRYIAEQANGRRR